MPTLLRHGTQLKRPLSSAVDRPPSDEIPICPAATRFDRTRGALKTFFGMAFRVGKTFAMQEAGRKPADRNNAVAGFVGSLGRAQARSFGPRVRYLLAIATVSACTGVGFALFKLLEAPNLVML